MSLGVPKIRRVSFSLEPNDHDDDNEDYDDDEEETDEGWSTDEDEQSVVEEESSHSKVEITSDDHKDDSSNRTGNVDWLGLFPFFSTLVDEQDDAVKREEEEEAGRPNKEESVIEEPQQKEIEYGDFQKKLNRTNRAKQFLSDLLCLDYIMRKAGKGTDDKQEGERSQSAKETETAVPRNVGTPFFSRKKHLRLAKRLRKLATLLQSKLLRNGGTNVDGRGNTRGANVEFNDVISVYSTALHGDVEGGGGTTTTTARNGEDDGAWQEYFSKLLNPGTFFGYEDRSQEKATM
jgi:hypothetical protein